MQIRDSVALVTGANRGIGRALVESLLERGAARVYATARDLASLDDVARLDSRRVRTIRLDVTSAEQARTAADQARDVALLINNAGVLTLGLPTAVPRDAVRANMETNFFGTLNVTEAFLPALERQHGAIVNLLTVVALASMPGLSAYNASKAAALSLTQSLRGELGKRGISVHGVFPGAIDTEMARPLEIPKTPPIDAARGILDGVEAGQEDIFPDPMSRQLGELWLRDPKAIERQFAAM